MAYITKKRGNKIMGNIIRYKHHGELVSVDADLKGTHKKHCLCYKCACFNPDKPKDNCHMAEILFRVCLMANMVTPVYECASFIENGGEEHETMEGV
jgi:hypothetical protein